MRCSMVLCPIVCIIQFAQSPIGPKLFLTFSVAKPVKSHVHCLSTFGWTFPLTTASAMALSVCKGVGGCLCPISSSMMQMYMALHAMMYSAASLALVADDITCLIMCAMFSMAILVEGTPAPLDRKKRSPALLLSFVFTKIAGITVHGKFHITGMVCDDGSLLGCNVVK